MNIREDDSLDEFVLNLTPMIDVVFLLLVFFMVTTTFMDEEQQIDVELPAAESAGEQVEQPDSITLTVDEAGIVFLEGEAIGKDELLGVLRGAAQHDAETPVTIRGHRGARHEAIVSVMDACGLAGLSNLAIGTIGSAAEGG
ncbi:MAG: biopolymer transporter ExbD [Planctomycetota bacterium]|nr:biopolymer transporter ExbD [Planctomycetota bacterium]